MKTVTFLLFSLFFLGISPAFAQWQVVHSGGGLNLVDGCFISNSVGLAISSTGVVLKSSDTGSTWVQKASLTGTFHAICEAGTDTVYAAGNYVYRSADQGETWTEVRGLGDTISDLVFFDSKNGYAIVRDLYYCIWGGPPGYYLDDYHVFKTTDGGVNWQAGFQIGEETSYFQQTGAAEAFVFGGTSQVYPHCGTGWDNCSKKTFNSGGNWSSALLPGIGSQMSMINPDTGYCVRPGWDKSHIWKTIDGTASYAQYVADYADATVNQCLFINDIDGYLKGPGRIYVTRSGGLTWKQDYISSLTLNLLFRNPSDFLFGIGANGLVVRKHIIPNALPEPVYRVNTDKPTLDFGMVPVSASLVKQLQVTNTGNMPVTLTLSSSVPFQVSSDGVAFGNLVTLPVNPNQSVQMFVRYQPMATVFSRDTLVISGDSLVTVKIPLTGSGYHALSGTISGDTLICADTVNINGDVKILQGARMVICPGTHVRFLDKYAIDVEGVLEAQGDSLRNITFGVFLPYGKWSGIRINNPGYQDPSILSWCILPVPCDSSSLTITSGDLHMAHCNVSNKSGTGIQATGPHARFSLTGCKISNTKNYAIRLSGCDSSAITNGYIYNNVQGIYGSSAGEVSVYGNWFYSNTGMAIQVVAGPGTMTIRQNKIFSNNTGIAFSGSRVHIVENEIHHQVDRGISCLSADSVMVVGNKIYSNYGGGVYLAAHYSRIENNEIYNNGSRGIHNQVDTKGCIMNQNLVFNNASNGAYITNESYSTTGMFLSNNTFCNNGSYDFLLEAHAGAKFQIQVVNNIFFSPNLMPCIIQNATVTSGFNCSSSFPPEGASNIEAVPDFARPTLTAGNIGETTQYDWTMKATSKTINAGDTVSIPGQLAFDFAGSPRIYEGRIDMGAYEYQDSIPKPSVVGGTGLLMSTRVFPNPASDILNVFAAVHGAAVIVLYDLSGRAVLQQDFLREAAIDFGCFAKGVYFYEICNRKGEIIGKGKIVKE